MRTMVMTALVAGLVVSGCASKNVFGVNEEGDPQSPDQILQTRYIPNECGAHISNEDLEGYYCRFLGARNAYHLAGSRYQHAVEAQNILTFGAAVYAGSTLALNSGGLRESQTDDLTETALGLGVIQAAASLLGVQRRNTLYRHASDASYCYASHIRMLIVRQQNFDELTQEDADENFPPFFLAGAIREVEDALADPQRHENADLEEARELLRNARTRLASLEEQRRLLQVAESELNQLAYTFVRTVEERARNEPLSYTDLIASIQQAAAAGVPADTGAPVDSIKTRSNGRDDPQISLPQAMEGLRAVLAHANRLAPDIGAIRRSIRTCPTILQEGTPVSFTPQDMPAGVFSLSGSQNSAQQPGGET